MTAHINMGRDSLRKQSPIDARDSQADKRPSPVRKPCREVRRKTAARVRRARKTPRASTLSLSRGVAKLSFAVAGGNKNNKKNPCGRLTESNPRRKASLRPQTQTPHSDGNKTMPGPLSGVVVSLSGYQNPERGNMRDAACSLGADYCPDFNERYLADEEPLPLLIFSPHSWNS